MRSSAPRRERRKGCGITRAHLAEQLGVAQQTMAHYENGTVRLTIATLAIVGTALDTAMEDLIDRTKNQ